MKRQAFLTTSWDDGHSLDARVADLLAKHGLTGTFYIPRAADTGTMPEADVRQLAAGPFEVGAHTVHHVYLDRATELTAEREITESRSWVEDVTGRRCPMFCPPGGKFDTRHLAMIARAGFAGVRTVELLSLDLPRLVDVPGCGALRVMPTTIQSHPHGPAAYVRNAARRRSPRNFWTLIRHGSSAGDWLALAEQLLARVAEHGGVFHLWGHSWEIEEAGQWDRLDVMLRLMSRYVGDVPCLTNGQLCAAVGAKRVRRGSAVRPVEAPRRPSHAATIAGVM